MVWRGGTFSLVGLGLGFLFVCFDLYFFVLFWFWVVFFCLVGVCFVLVGFLFFFLLSPERGFA